MNASTQFHLASVRPLVRYVDKEQAVIEMAVQLQPPLPLFDRPASFVRDLYLLLEVNTAEGFHDEHLVRIDPRDGHHRVRMEIVQPQRWWPANMGDQPLYELKVSLIADNELVDVWDGSVGLTSVRRRAPRDSSVLMVNGEECAITTVIPVDLIDERHLLPVSGDSLMIVRGHWGPDVLYDAADRAGILLVQCVPVDNEGRPEAIVADQIDRLSGHPSLAGWYVGHLGKYTERMSYCIRSLDPTRNIFRRIPGKQSPDPAAA